MPEQDHEQSPAADTFDAVHSGGGGDSGEGGGETVASTEDEQLEGGQRSNVQNFADAGEPVSDSQSVAGQPSDEPGSVQEGGVGPNSIPPENAERTGIDFSRGHAPEGASGRESEEEGDRAGHPHG